MRNLPLLPRLILAAISGAMVIPISYLEKIGSNLFLGISLTDILIATVFAFLVMVPFQKRKNQFNAVLMVIASIAIYTFVAKLATSQYYMQSLNLSYSIGIIISGGLGALLTGVATQILAPIRLSSKAYLTLIAIGLIAGAVFSYTIESNSGYIVAMGFITWQMLVCLTIYKFKK